MSFRLLLADDSPTIRRMVELTFADEPMSMVSVGGGRAALDEIAARPPDIVIADAALLPPDGYEVTSFVKRTPALAHIPVILLIGAFEAVEQARAAEAGCDAVLAKPLDPPELEWKVKHLLRQPAREGPADITLADRFDAIDAGLAHEAGSRDERTGFNAPENEESCATKRGLLSLNDYFDRIDDECRRPHQGNLMRAFRALLDAARSRRPGRNQPGH